MMVIRDAHRIAELIRSSYQDRGAENATILRNRIMQGMATILREDNPYFDSDEFIRQARAE